HAQQGSFLASCGCSFENGTGNGFMVAALFELPIDYEWAIGLKAGVDWKNTSGTVPQTEKAVIQYGFGDTVTVNDLAVDRKSTVSTTYVNVAPYVQYQFFRMGPFVEAGVQAGFL